MFYAAFGRPMPEKSPDFLAKLGWWSPIYSNVNIAIDVFSLAVLLVIFLNDFRRNKEYSHEQKLFRSLLHINTLIIAFDVLMWILDGKSGLYLHETYLAVTGIYYILNPLICFVWYLYVDFFIYRSESRLKKVILPMAIPAGVNLVLGILSIFYNLYFYIDNANTYYRGSLFYLMAAIAFFYLAYAFTIIIIRRKTISRRDFLPLLFFAVPPLIGAIFQTMVYGLSLIWPCATISMLVIYINIQNNQLHKDYLTGLFNRRQLDHYLQYAIQDFGDGLLAGIMIDLNLFKMINDVYGHSAGDDALQHTAAILKKTFRKNDFIARYGGDEFIVLAVFQRKEDLDITIGRLQDNVRKFNQQNIVPYNISLSMGYDFYSGGSRSLFTGFLKHLDDLMYQDKTLNSQ